MNTPAANRFRNAISRCVPTPGAGAGKGKDAREVGSRGGKRVLGAEGLGVHRGISYGRRLG